MDEIGKEIASGLIESMRLSSGKYRAYRYCLTRR